MKKLVKAFCCFAGLFMLVSLASADNAVSKKADTGLSKPDNIVDDMSAAPIGWTKEKDRGVTLTIAAGTGQKGKALELSYNFGDEGNWLGVRKRIVQDVSGYKGIRFAVRGDGKVNSIQVKLENNNSSNFGVVLPIKSNTNTWSPVDVPFSSLEYLWGDSQDLSLNKPLLHIAVVKKESDDEGGSGTLVIDKIELYK